MTMNAPESSTKVFTNGERGIKFRRAYHYQANSPSTNRHSFANRRLTGRTAARHLVGVPLGDDDVRWNYGRRHDNALAPDGYRSMGCSSPGRYDNAGTDEQMNGFARSAVSVLATNCRRELLDGLPKSLRLLCRLPLPPPLHLPCDLTPKCFRSRALASPQLTRSQSPSLDLITVFCGLYQCFPPIDEEIKQSGFGVIGHH